MKIKLKKIELHNFLSFENAILDLDVSGYTLVQGVNHNPTDSASSNGSGKSTIFEAISWAITGETIRGSKEVKRISSDKSDNCLVDVYFDIDNIPYVIRRQSNPSKLSFIVGDKDVSGKGIRDTEVIVKEYLPDLTSSLIGSVIILGQGLPQRFTNNTPSGRKEVLEKLSKSDFMIQDLKNRISNRKKELDSLLRSQEDLLLSTQTEEGIIKKNLESTKQKLVNMPDPTELLEHIEVCNSKLTKLDTVLYNLNASLSEKMTFQNKCIETKNEVYKLNEEEVENLKRPYNEKLNELSETRSTLNAEIQSLQREITRINSIKDVCPTCGQKLPGVEKPSTDKQVNELNELELKLSDINATLKSVNSEVQLKLTDLKSKHESEYKNLEKQYSDVVKEIGALNLSIDDCKREIGKYQIDKVKYANELGNIQQKKLDLENDMISYQDRLSKLSSQILYINNDIDELQKHLDVIQKMNTVITRDFRGYLLTSVIDFINRKAKEYSQEVFNTEKIDFILDGNNISISYDGKDYSNLSGGERQKIDLITQFAIRDMLCKYLNFSSNVLAVDELFDSLDSIGCEKVLNLITKKLSDVETIYIITHHSSIPIPFDNILTVVKGEDGISRLDAIQ